MMCAIDPRFPESGGADTCPGDDGGPLFVMKRSAMHQQGITSFGTKCGVKGSIGWYTNLKTYTKDIRQYMREDYTNWNEIFKLER